MDPSPTFRLTPLLFPGQGQAWVSAFHCSSSWTSERKGHQKGPVLTQDTGWVGVRVWAPGSQGRVGRH